MSRKMKDSGIEWIGQIPEAWDVLPHKYIMYKKKEICDVYNGENILSLTMNGVIVRDLENPTGKMPATFDGYQRVKAGNLLLCLFDIDVTPRCVGYIEDDGLTSPAYSQFVLKPGYNARYYNYLLQMIDDGKYFLHLAKNLRSSFTEEAFGQIKSIVPPYEEQEKIVVALDARLKDIIFNLIALKESIKDYKKYKQAIITELVTQGLDDSVKVKDSNIEHIGRIPEHWRLVRLKYVLGESGERTKDGTEEPLSMSQKYGLIPTKDMDMIPNMASSFGNCKIVHKNDLVFNKLKAHLGVFAKSNYEGLVSPDYAVYQAKTNDNVLYLEYLFKTPQYISQFIKYSRGIAQGLTRLYTEDLFNIYVALPPVDEQNAITELIFKKCVEIDNLIAAKEKTIKELEAYKKSLIYEYVTGKKEVI